MSSPDYDETASLTLRSATSASESAESPESPPPNGDAGSKAPKPTPRRFQSVMARPTKSPLERDFFATPVQLIRSTPKVFDDIANQASLSLKTPDTRDVETPYFHAPSVLPAPNSYFGLAVFSWCCCLLNPLALFAFAFSLRSQRRYDAGDLLGARKWGSRAFCCGVVAVVFNAILIGLFIAGLVYLVWTTVAIELHGREPAWMSDLFNATAEEEEVEFPMGN